MDIVPVVDLRGGQVVHARMGRRHDYRPIATPLSRTSRPEDVVAGLLGVGAFRRLYVADLDAIESRGTVDPIHQDGHLVPKARHHDDALRRIAAAYPALEIWVDRGTSTLPEATAWLHANPATLVLGSESLADTRPVHALRGHPRVVLSLDFRADRFTGPPELLQDAGCWPDRVIAMTLARVGAASGPDIDCVASLAARAGTRRIYAAGGVRHDADLLALQRAGAHGALAATALHTGALHGPAPDGAPPDGTLHAGPAVIEH